MVLGSQILCNNGRYEFLTTSIAEDFITWTSKSSLTSWRWQLDWAVFQCSGDITTRMMVVHFYLTIRHDPHRRDCRVNWREIFCGCHWLMQASCHSRAFKVLDPRVDDIDLERFCRPSHDDQDVFFLGRCWLVGILLFILVELLSTPDWEQG